jgi:hypothetical protein
MSGSDPWAAFPVVQADPPQADPWAAFPVAAPSQSLAGMVALRLGTMADNTARTLARGATLGAMDEIAAAANATVGSVTGQPGTWSERYGQNLQAERTQDAAFDRRNPALSLAGQAAGGVLMGGPVLSGARSLPGAMMRGAATGAGYGGVAGFGTGEGGFGNRAINAGEGALIGAGIGAALPAAIAGGAGVAGAASRMVNPSARSADAQRLLLRDLGRDGVSPQDLLRSSDAAGNAPVALVDLAGDNVRGAAQAVARLPGEGQRLAGDLLRERSGPQQAERLRQSIREAVSAEDFSETMTRTTQRRREEAAPNYERAYAVELPADPRLQSFLSDPDIRRGVLDGVASIRREALARGEPFDLAAYGVRQGDGGALELVDGAMPTRLFDAAKRGLDRLEEGARNGVGAATSQSREIAELRRSLLARVDELNPDYAAARQAYAGDSALLSAAQDGRRLATVRPEDFEMTAAEIRRMTQSERDFFRMGVARGLVDRINSAGDGAEATRLRQLFGTPFMREKLAATFDNPADYERFAQTMQQEIGIASTNRAIDPRGGSPTMPLAARRDDLANPPRGGVSLGAVGGEGGTGVNTSQLGRNAMGLGGIDYAALNFMDQVSRARAAGRLERNSNELARMLFTSQPEARSRLAEELIRRSLRDASAAGLTRPIAQGGQRAGGVVGGNADTPLTRQR